MEGWDMDFVKAQFDRLQKQLGDLSASQKMLTGTLVVIMVMTMLYWGKYAGNAEMVPVLDQAFSADDITRVSMKLKSLGINVKVTGDRVLVPADKHDEALATLAYENLLPQDIQSGVEAMAAKISPFSPSSEVKAIRNDMKQKSLAATISRYPGVRSARVFIDPREDARIGSKVEATASIDIQMKPGHSPTKHLINAAARFVHSAQAGLPLKNVNVTVDGVYHSVDGANEDSVTAAAELMDQKYRYQEMEERKIRDHLAWLRGQVFVSVNVDMNITSSQQQETLYDPKNTVHKEVKIETRTDESSSTSQVGGEAGLVANAALEVENAGPTDSTTQSKSEESVQFQLLASQTTRTSRTPAGGFTVKSATVRVPRSFFVNAYKAQNPGGSSEPDKALLDEMIAREIAIIKDEVMKVTAVRTPDDVAVSTYLDVAPADLAMATEVASSSPVSLSISGHAKEIAVGALAVISLFMVSMMVRKGSPPSCCCHWSRTRLQKSSNASPLRPLRKFRVRLRLLVRLPSQHARKFSGSSTTSPWRTPTWRKGGWNTPSRCFASRCRRMTPAA
jgi:flagellar biosynthesis/type III secretory pathway M-ring protein FliF/YscJ